MLGYGPAGVGDRDLLTRLVEKSLVVAGERDGEARYHLLEPARQYALGKLGETDEASDVRGRHRDFFLALAERGHLGLASAERLVWRARIESDHDNIRAALRWSIDNRSLEEATRLGAAMARFWASIQAGHHEGSPSPTSALCATQSFRRAVSFIFSGHFQARA